ncbi:MAG: hypothetical protein PWQ87_189 [Candidatus Woesearchaeota archaeon]|nr:hypothetical protein [Candidatus Woesearchaeota archaeon]
MKYKSFCDLNKDIKKWLLTLPKVDLVVGIPRSGLIPATLISLYRNIPLTDVEGLIEKRLFSTGKRYTGKEIEWNSDKTRVLIIDDSVWSGRQINIIKKKIKDLNIKYNIKYAAVYVAPTATRIVDFYYEILNPPRVFEWNIMHHGILENSCVDIDGVLCRDPLEEENDDGERYKQFIQNADEYMIPTKKIGWLVTSRLEKYRSLTEEWLKKHNVKYNHLIMMPFDSKEERIRAGNYADFKTKIYKNTNAELFIESSFKQAVEIANKSGKSVFCVETNEMIQPGSLIKNKIENTKSLLSKGMREFKKHPIKTLPKITGYIFNRFFLTPIYIIGDKMKKKRKSSDNNAEAGI